MYLTAGSLDQNCSWEPMVNFLMTINITFSFPKNNLKFQTILAISLLLLTYFDTYDFKIISKVKYYEIEIMGFLLNVNEENKKSSILRKELKAVHNFFLNVHHFKLLFCSTFGKNVGVSYVYNMGIN